MKLIIAEKPSLGRAIADALPTPHKKHKTHIECGDYVVTWCFGHLLELKMPSDYDENYKNWANRPIPFIPEKWERLVVADKKEQVAAIKNLMGSADIIINAGDPDREGSMLVDSVIEFLGWGGDVWRLLISDVNPKAVKRSLDKMDKFNSTEKLSLSADARAKADWLYGINLTTSYTLAARQKGYEGVLNVGRVQTPVLGLIVNRKLERDNFKPHEFYNVIATLNKGDEFKAKLNLKKINGEFDSEGRLIEKPTAEKLKDDCLDKPAIVKSIISETVNSFAPALFSLSELQKVANKKLGLTATETLAAAQELYQSQATTYPRSDCSYITVELWEDAPETLAALTKLNSFAENADSSIKHTCVNDEKVGAHHAIIPTDNVPDLEKLKANKNVYDVYELIVSRYVSIFYPPAIDDKTECLFDIGGHEFISKGIMEKQRGWRDVVYVKSPDAAIPVLEENESVPVNEIIVETSLTTPPKEYTEATLLGAMTNIAKYVSDDSLKAILKETDGLGTEATRASIIENLVKREFLVRDKKRILPTDKGVEFIQQLPEEITLPDMTAMWELMLSDIADSKKDSDEFISEIITNVERLVLNPEIKITNVAGIPCPACKENLRRLQRKDKSSFFWACSNKECDFICNDNRGKPAETVIHSCPDCSKKLTRRKSGKEWFWACTGYKEGCKFSTNDNKGKPAPKTEKPAATKTDMACPDCGSDMYKRKGKYGEFYGCSSYPKCKKIIKVG